MAMTMFEINDSIRAVLDKMGREMETEGFVSDETLAEYEALSEAKDDKMESIALYYKETQAEADAIKAEAKKLAERAEVAQKKADSLKGYLSRIMEIDEMEKFTTSRVKVSFRKSESVIVDDDLKNVDERFVITKTTYAADKASIKEAIKNGEDVKGAHLETKQNIQIK